MKFVFFKFPAVPVVSFFSVTAACAVLVALLVLPLTSYANIDDPLFCRKTLEPPSDWVRTTRFPPGGIFDLRRDVPGRSFFKPEMSHLVEKAGSDYVVIRDRVPEENFVRQLLLQGQRIKQISFEKTVASSVRIFEVGVDSGRLTAYPPGGHPSRGRDLLELLDENLKLADHVHVYLGESEEFRWEKIAYHRLPESLDGEEREWEYKIEVPISDVRFLSSPHVWRAEEFARRYPFDPSDLSKPQSYFRYQRHEYLIESYDAETGRVVLFRDTINSKGALVQRDRLVMPFSRFVEMIETGRLMPMGDRTRTLNRGPESRARPLWERFVDDGEQFAVRRMGGRDVSFIGRTRQIVKVDLSEGIGSHLVERECYVYVFQLKAPKNVRHRIEVVIPVQATAEEDTRWGLFARRLLLMIPKGFENVVPRIDLLVDHENKIVNGRATINTTVPKITMWKGTLSDERVWRLTFWHELAHLIAFSLWDRFTPLADWLLAMGRDGAMGHEPLEDFAYTFEKYMESDGGERDPKVREAYRERFAVLDRILAFNKKNIDDVSEAAQNMREVLGASSIWVTRGAGVAVGAGSLYWLLDQLF